MAVEKLVDRREALQLSATHGTCTARDKQALVLRGCAVPMVVSVASYTWKDLHGKPRYTLVVAIHAGRPSAPGLGTACVVSAPRVLA